jgi:acyl carrier protein
LIPVYTVSGSRYIFVRFPRRTSRRAAFQLKEPVAAAVPRWRTRAVSDRPTDISRRGRREDFRRQFKEQHVSDSEISEKIKDIVSDKLDVPREDVDESKHFVNDLKADSLALVELGMAFEDNFGISIPDEDYEKLKTVGDAIGYVKKARGG